MNKLLGVLLLMFISTSCFSWTVFGPKNYDECILENMKGVSSDSATMLIENSCRVKFTEKEVVSNPKHNWIRLGVKKNDKVSLYKDKSTITRHGNIVTVVLMFEHDKVQIGKYDVQYYSEIVQTEIDCDRFKIRILKDEFISGHMSIGDIVQTDNVTPETELPKNELLYKEFCNN